MTEGAKIGDVSSLPDFVESFVPARILVAIRLREGCVGLRLRK